MTAPSEQEREGATLDVEALRPKPCGCCDGGLLMACICRDYRNDLDRALDEVERLRTQIERERQQARQEALSEAFTRWRDDSVVGFIVWLSAAGGVS